ncbi:MAG: hypothetical protein CMQ61_06540 [Gammaproteobacteria bacterium]|nr:hypothetical protein [Gammaproteobacteria bacterium]
MTDTDDLCNCQLCIVNPDHPARRFHNLFRRLRHLLTHEELAACVVQYADLTQMGDGDEGILCQMSKLSPADLQAARAVVNADREGLAADLANAPTAIAALAGDEFAKEWLTSVAVAVATQPNDFVLREVELSINLHGQAYTLCLPADWMAYSNLFEVLIRRNYEHQRVPVERIYDFGAYIGLSSVYLHSYYPQAQVVAVEASAANMRAMTRTLASNDGLIASPEVVHTIVAGRSGTATLVSVEGASCSTNMLCSTVMDVEGAKRTTGEATGLAELVQPDRPYGIKLDIEGGEFGLAESRDALAGATWILGEFHYGLWSQKCDIWLRQLLERRFTLNLQVPRLEMTGNGEYFCVGHDYTALARTED